MVKKYTVGNPRGIPVGTPIKSRRQPDDDDGNPVEDIHFYEGDTWYPGPATTPAMIKGWVKDKSLIEVKNG